MEMLLYDIVDGAGEIVQWEKCLLCKHEDPSLHKSQACAWNPSVRDEEISDAQGPSLQPVFLKH